jgi:formate/nitrite transporter
MQKSDGKRKQDAVAQTYNPSLTPQEFSQTISALGIRKANTKAWQLCLLGLLAGLYISVGSHLFLVAMQAGMGRLVGGAAFSVGLVLVVVAGAELFTGNIIMVVGTLTRQFSVNRMMRNWLVVYLGNLSGALLFVALIQASGLLFRDGSITPLGQVAGEIAVAKLQLSFVEAFVRGILCNMLVVLAIIMTILAKDIISKIACCMLPIMAFVASGFEHSIANMYLIPAGMLAQGSSWSGLWESFRNIGPVTLGNIVGGLAILILHPNRIRQLLLLAFKKEV